MSVRVGINAGLKESGCDDCTCACTCTWGGWYLHNGIHGTRFLTETAVDALGHINVIARGLAGAVGTRLGLNGDGLREILAVNETGLQVYFQAESGFDFASNHIIEFPGQAVGWDLSTQYGDSGSASIIALIDGQEVLVWRVADQSLLEPVSIKRNLGGYISKGINRLHFSRDINGDGIDDFLIPGAGVINLYISSGRPDGGALSYQAMNRCWPLTPSTG